MKTVTICIGNSDDKLTQVEWSNFCKAIRIVLHFYTVHFSGVSNGSAAWQNACWVFELPEDKEKELKSKITEIRKHFRQDSVAWTEGNTEFI